VTAPDRRPEGLELLLDAAWQTLSVAATDGGDIAVTVRGTGEGNVLGGAFWSELVAFLELVGDVERPGTVLLAGSGDDFSRGLDLRWYLTRLRRARRDGAVAEAVLADIRRLQEAITALATCPCAVIAVVDGECTGAALELVAACDVRFATRSARFSLPEADLGVVADLGGLQRLPHLVGEGFVRELVLSGATRDAEYARRTGLVNDVFDTRTAADAAARELADQIRTTPPAVVTEIKRVLDASHRAQVDVGLARVARWNSDQVATAGWEHRMAARLAGTGGQGRGAGS
jgi:enoyl-CoA hydratase